MGNTLLITLVAIVLMLGIWFAQTTHLREEFVKITGGSPGEPYYGVIDTDKKNDKEKEDIKFDLVDPESAPEMMLTKILYGYYIMLDTKEHTPDYAGNSISCNNCHFNGGNTLGGKNRGISLVGVTALYPQFSKRAGKQITLADRINNCFQRSLNGKPLPVTSLEMEALIAYLAWISHEVVDAPILPWLGLEDVPSKHTPDVKIGEKIYQEQCTICHNSDGSGTLGAPPLWGPNSFNDGAGMDTLPMLSSFVWLNMPYGQPALTPDEALDVSAYIIMQSRPHFSK